VPFLDFRDPWGNRIEIVDYENIQFTKAPNVLRGTGLDHLTKNESAKQQLTDKGMGGIDPFRADQRKDKNANH
jgi:lactoylglutathione lyase